MEILLHRIIVDNNLLDGKPAIRGKRISVQTILEFLSAGTTRQEILYQYPSLEEKDIDACLQYAAKVSGL
ncbi:MAG: DUF433 domain-containing protein [Bacteroidota bacterium]|nr:DUF433 domain-containing protein [Bacteroidota bacterium]